MNKKKRLFSLSPQKNKNFLFFSKRWWINFEHTYDQAMSNALWNKSITPENYKKTDYIEQIVNDRNKVLDTIMYFGEQRANATTHYLTLNSAFMSVYAYGASHAGWFNHLIMVITFFILSIFSSISWIVKIRSCIQYNTANFAMIRQYQELLPSKPFGDAIIQVLNYSTPNTFRPILDVETWLPRLFLFWYIILFIFNLNVIYHSS